MINITRKHLLVALLAGVMMLFGASAALAANGDTIPHGGYSTATDACLQCHDVHEAAGDYILGRWSTVTYLCGSCHTLYQTPPSELVGGNYNPTTANDPFRAVAWDKNNPAGTGMTTESTAYGAGPGDVKVNYDPNYTGLEAPIPGWSLYDVTANMGDTNSQVGMGAPFEAYEKARSLSDGSDGKRGHRLGTSFALGDSVNHADNVVDALDYIPGSSSRLTAIRTPSVADSALSNGTAYFASMPTTSVSEFPVSLNGGLYCASCHSPHGLFSGLGSTGDAGSVDLQNNSNMISPLVKNKLLSSRPNHSTTASDFDGGTWLDDGGREFCGKCHDKRMSSSTNLTHSHPDFACLECHAKESIVADGSAPKNDFPHTSSNPNLLSQEPDGLCINCHAPGALPLP